MYDFPVQLEHPRRSRLSVALVSRYGTRPAPLARFGSRLVWDPCDIRTSDDVILFHGLGMAKELGRFTTEAEGELPPTVFLAPQLDWDDVSQALDHGAVSYLLENRYAYLLNEALMCASRGASILDPVIAASQIRTATQARARRREHWTDNPAPLIQLSPQERQIMTLLTSSLRVREVAREMFLTEKTVRNYLSRIYKKLGVHSQSEAILHWLGQTSRGDQPGPTCHRQASDQHVLATSPALRIPARTARHHDAASRCGVQHGT